VLTSQKRAAAIERPNNRGPRSQTVPHQYVRTTRPIHEMQRLVEGEYREMPGLSLTLPQAARLWGLDHRTCELVLTDLIERRVLKRLLNGTYVRR
jgi:hypothetical protein